MVKKDKNSKLGWKIGSVIIIAFFAAIIGFLIWFFYVGSTKEIVAVADQFKTDPSWDLSSERVEPPRNFCIDIECPSLSRQWKTDSILSKEELREYLKMSGWDFNIEGDCLVDKNISGTAITLCSASGVVNGYKVTVYISGSSTPDSEGIGLSVDGIK
jgi:hypothetical protein